MLEIFLKNVGQQLAGQQELEEIFFFVFLLFRERSERIEWIKRRKFALNRRFIIITS